MVEAAPSNGSPLAQMRFPLTYKHIGPKFMPFGPTPHSCQFSWRGGTGSSTEIRVLFWEPLEMDLSP